MRAYLGYLRADGLAALVPEELFTLESLPHALPPPSARAAVPFRAILAEDDAEAIRTELGLGRPDLATALLRDRAVELLPMTGPATRSASASGPLLPD